MTRKTGIVAAILAIAFAGLQFVQQPVQNPPADKPLQAPQAVVTILQRACYDCHSNRTQLRWYDKIAPASWLVNAHVQEGRSRFNFSTWNTLSAADQAGRVWEMVNMALTNKMPLGSYTAVHPAAKLSGADIAVLKAYAVSLSPAKFHDSTVILEADKEYAAYTTAHTTNTQGLKAANGVAYIPDFQHWQVISTTDRFDLHSLRVVYANDILVKAIAEHRTHPFPQGATIVKAVWNSIEESNGDIRPGSLNSIQIMTKDDQRFPDSKGWGFAKFNGYDLKPFGATPLFNTTCFNCHKIADKQDYLFNLPLENKDGQREVFPTVGLQVITSFANRQLHTMSVLYGNANALQSAIGGYKTHGNGELYRLVTYEQADNKYWYGSYINGTVKSVETIRSNAAGALVYSLDKGCAPQAEAAGARMASIFSRRPAVFP